MLPAAAPEYDISIVRCPSACVVIFKLFARPDASSRTRSSPEMLTTLRSADYIVYQIEMCIVYKSAGSKSYTLSVPTIGRPVARQAATLRLRRSSGSMFCTSVFPQQRARIDVSINIDCKK